MGGSNSRSVEVNGEKYKIGRVLGKGAYGKVFVLLRKDPATKFFKTFAMKQMDKRKILEKKVVKNIINEKDILIDQNTSNAFILHVVRTYQTEDDLCMVMDFMAGGDLRYHVGMSGHFTEEQTRFYATQMLIAIEHLHSCGVMHRDIKPDNLLMDGAGYCYIADFNVSIRAKRVTRKAGTSKYMAPEMLEGKEYGFEVDYWSLGITLYELSCGKVPFQTSEEIISEALAWPTKVQFSDELKELLTGLLEKDPKKRFGATESKSSPFFKTTVWEDILAKQVPAPYIPEREKAHCNPDHEFEEVFGSQRARREKISEEDQLLFKEWDWPAPAPSIPSSPSASPPTLQISTDGIAEHTPSESPLVSPPSTPASLRRPEPPPPPPPELRSITPTKPRYRFFGKDKEKKRVSKSQSPKHSADHIVLNEKENGEPVEVKDKGVQQD